MGDSDTKKPPAVSGAEECESSTVRTGSFVAYTAAPPLDFSSSIWSSTSDHGHSPNLKIVGYISDQGLVESAATESVTSGGSAAGGARTAGTDSSTTASPSTQIKRRYFSLNDVRQAGNSGSFPPSNSLGSVAAAAAAANREAAPPVDPNALPDILMRTQNLADSLASSIEKVSAQLRTMAKLTVENLNVIDETAANSCESAEQLVKTLYSLMSRYDELRKELYIIPTVSQQLKEIERLLDVLEMHASQAEKSRP